MGNSFGPQNVFEGISVYAIFDGLFYPKVVTIA
jgi:hypothetical protein